MCKAKILANLKGRVNFVAEHCATSGLDFAEGTKSLNELVSEGKVEKNMVNFPSPTGDETMRLPMYRAFPGSYGEIGTNKSHLNLVK